MVGRPLLNTPSFHLLPEEAPHRVPACPPSDKQLCPCSSPSTLRQSHCHRQLESACIRRHEMSASETPDGAFGEGRVKRPHDSSLLLEAREDARESQQRR